MNFSGFHPFTTLFSGPCCKRGRHLYTTTAPSCCIPASHCHLSATLQTISIIVVSLQNNRAVFRIFIALFKFFIWPSLIRVNKIVNQDIRLNSRDIKRSSDFCHLGSVVSEDSAARTDINVRIQKARGSLSKLKKVWLSTSIRKDTKIRIFNACVKSVFLYGCETWPVTIKIWRKIQTFVNPFSARGPIYRPPLCLRRMREADVSAHFFQALQ
jgi:hypothetical protein